MLYKSTRGSIKYKNSGQAIIAGLAEDKGLYVPVNIPPLPFSLEEGKEMSYRQVAKKIIGAYFDDFTEEEIAFCVDSAYDSKFDAKEIVPLARVGQSYFMELYHGKTAAFKDMALSILPYLLVTALKKEGIKDRICILTATSGDTGKAALEGFADVPGTEIMVFYPETGVSLIQEKQMTSQEGNNTHVYGIRGNFDDAQRAVKEIFNDKDFGRSLAREGIRLSSANSINIGRLVPQIVYYVYAYLQLLKSAVIKPGQGINVVVPTGNFGNILASWYGGKMGLPIKKYICASNKNKVLTDFIKTGLYDIRRDFYVTNSPSMDILVSSNLERLLFHLSDGDSFLLRDMMGALDKEKYYRANDCIINGLSNFYGNYSSIEDTNRIIGKMYEEEGYLLDTHTAVAYKVYEDYLNETGDRELTLIASTASPYKFAKSVAEALGLDKEKDEYAYIDSIYRATGVRVPKGLIGLKEKEVLHKSKIDPGEMKEEIWKQLHVKK